MEAFYLEAGASKEQIQDVLEEWGVAVIVRHFSANEAEKWRQEIFEWLKGLSGGKLKETVSGWKDEYLPSGPRSGMFQSLISSCPTVVAMREAIYPLFVDVLEDEELLTSLDGASVHPLGNGGHRRTKNQAGKPEIKDWPHIDQTVTGITCVQGQVVLSDSLAAFRCSPTSHKLHERILTHCDKVGVTSNWLHFSPKVAKSIKAMLPEGYWQIPVHAPAGSVILWRSNTIHSAVASAPLPAWMTTRAETWARESANESMSKSGVFGERGWRCVVYICLRRRSEYAAHEIYRLKDAALQGRMTNHWGTKVFPLRSKRDEADPAVAEYLNHPDKLAIPEARMTELYRRLIGAADYE